MKKSLFVLSAIACFVSFTASAQKLSSADAILTRYVEVIGGQKKWAVIKTSEFHVNATYNGKKMDLLIIKAGPGKYYESITGENLDIVNVYNAGKGINVTNGKQKAITDQEMLDYYELQSCILPDMSYKQLGYKRVLNGVKDVNGEACYEVELTSKNGSATVNYYAQKSGLLIRVDKSGVKTYLLDYRFYKGSAIPYTMKGYMPNGTEMTFRVADWLINDKTSKAAFDDKIKLAEL